MRAVRLLLVAMCASLGTGAALAQETVAGSRVPLTGHTLDSALLARARSAPPAAQVASSTPITLTVVLRRTDEDGFQQLLADLYDPGSPRYRRFLTPRQVADAHGPAEADYLAVESHFTAQGFTVGERSANRMTLTLRGTRAQAEAAFATRIDDLTLGERRFYANRDEPTLPPAIARKVHSVTGLSNLAVATSLHGEQQHQDWQKYCAWAGVAVLEYEAYFLFIIGTALPEVLGALAGIEFILCTGENLGYAWYHPTPRPPLASGDAPLSAARRAAADGMLPGVGLATGAGQRIGLVQFDTFRRSDVADWLALWRLPPRLLDHVSETHVNGGATLGAGTVEVLLDIATVMSVAPEASIVVYDAPLGTSFQAMFNAAINGGSTIISNSWAYCEDQTTLSDVSGIETILQSAAASGISVFNASGDSGSTCLNGSPGTVVVPGSSPTATAVGGTSATGGPAMTQGTETWWNGAAAVPPSGSGGFGVSRYFARPVYQNGLTASAFRSIPDVSAHADPANGIMICQAGNGGCPDGKLYGGTSMSAPAWAAHTALLNQALGGPLGFVNPSLYPLAGTPAFRGPAALASDFAHVGLGTPRLASMYLALSGRSTGLPDAAASSLLAVVHGDDVAKLVPTGFPADGTTEVLVRVGLMDAARNPVAGKTVALAASPPAGVTITPATAVTGSDGAAVFRMTSTAIGNVTLTATDTSDGIVLADHPVVPFVAPKAAAGSIAASPNVIVNNGTASTTITVTLQDANGQPSPGKRIVLSQGGGRSIISGPSPAVTNAAGQVQFTATSTIAGAVTYTAVDLTDGNLPVPGSATVTFGGVGDFSCVPTPRPTAAPGFTLTPFSTGYLAAELSSGGVNWGCRGASNPAFARDGSAFVGNFVDGSLFLLPPEGGAAALGNAVGTYGPTLFGPVLARDGRMYAARGSLTGPNSGVLLELDPLTGAPVRTVMTGLACPTGLIADTRSADLFFATSCFGAGFDNPALARIRNPGSASPSVETYVTLPAVPVGWLGIAPDGTIFVPQSITGGAGAPVLTVTGTDKPFPPAVTPVPGLTTIYWVTVAEALPDGAAKSLIVLQDTTIRLADITTNPPTFTDLVEHGVGSGVVGPDGCLYVGGWDTVYKLAPASGPCTFARTSPAPALILAPGATTLPQGSELVLTAQFQGPLPPSGTPVRFSLGNTSRATQIGHTDAAGNATAAFVGRFVGSDVAVATADVGAASYASNPASVTWTSGKHSTLLTMNLGPGNAPVGQPVTLRASLVDQSTRPAVGLPAQTVTFTLGPWSCVAVTDASGQAGCSVTPLLPGRFTLVADYAGNAAFLPVSIAEEWLVVAPPTTTLASAPPSVPVGTPFTLTATIDAALPTGTVSFSNGLEPLPACTGVLLTGSGNVRTAHCTVTSLGVGSYALTASYSGDASNLPSQATLVQLVTANAGPPCGGFSDVDPASPFCANVEWLANRNVTLGCDADLYCAEQPVIRLAMAAFMNRLGSTLSGQVLAVQGTPASVDLDSGAVVCSTGDIDIDESPRRATGAAWLSALAASDASFVVTLVASFDAGASWAPMSTTGAAASAGATRWGHVRVPGTRDLDVGQVVRFGLQVSRGGLAGSADLTSARCNLRIVVGNQNPVYAPH